MTEAPGYKVIIIGAGPAGMAAAIQLCRYGCPPMLLEKDRPGGLLWNANLVENYPGFPDGISGPDLIRLCERQLARVGGEVVSDEVIRLDRDGESFLVEQRQQMVRADYVLVASGTRARPFPIPVPAAAREHVFSEVFPLLDLRGKQIAIVGGGDAAFDYALNLSRRNSVTILNRAERFTCLPLLKERAAEVKQIQYRSGCALVEILPSLTSSGRLQIKCDQAGESTLLETDGLIFAIGREPQIGFISDRIQADRAALTETGRLLFAGDVVRGRFRQAAIAAGDGLLAAMRIIAKMEDET